MQSRDRFGVRRTMPWWLVVAVTMLAAGGCVDDRGVGLDGASARVALRAQVGVVAATALSVESAYLRDDQSSVALDVQSLPLPSGTAPGRSVELPLTLSLAACIADPRHVPAGQACTVTLTLSLLDGTRELDRVTVGPFVVRPGETMAPEAVSMREVAGVVIDGPAELTLSPGGSLDLDAHVVDGDGAPLAERAITWSSDAPTVAGVVATGTASARVTALGLGTARIRASGGGRSAEVEVAIHAPPVIAASPTQVTFAAIEGDERPAAQVVALSNASGGPMGGLAVSGVTYAGSQVEWLEASLSSATAPATLTLRPTHTSLPPGQYSATVHVAADAENAPLAVAVRYQVTTSAIMVLSTNAVTFDLNQGIAPPYEAFVGITAVGHPAGTSWGIDRTVFNRSPTDWLALAAVNPETPTGIFVSLARVHLPPATYTADLYVRVDGVGNSPLPVRVTLVVPDFTQFSYSVEGDATVLASGESMQVTARLVNTEGQPVDGIPVQWEVLPAGAGTFLGIESRTGIARTFVAGTFQGQVDIVARLGAANASVAVTLNMAPVMAPPPAAGMAPRAAPRGMRHR